MGEGHTSREGASRDDAATGVTATDTTRAWLNEIATFIYSQHDRQKTTLFAAIEATTATLPYYQLVKQLHNVDPSLHQKRDVPVRCRSRTAPGVAK